MSCVRKFLFLLLFPLAVPTLANPVAVDKNDAFRPMLNDWEFGEVWFGTGAKIKTNKLKGQAVVIHHWAVNSSKCLAMLPRLAELEKANREKGLVIIGAETSGADKKQIEKLLETNHVGYAVTNRAKGPVEVMAPPHALIFDSEGECIYDGDPDGPQFIEYVNKAISTAKPTHGGSDQPSKLPERAEHLLESRTWKNAELKEITAAVKSADDKSVTFILPNGKHTIYPLEKLSAESREAITAARDAATKTE